MQSIKFYSSIAYHREIWFSPGLASDKQQVGDTRFGRYTHSNLEAATWILGFKVFQTFKFIKNLVVMVFLAK